MVSRFPGTYTPRRLPQPSPQPVSDRQTSHVPPIVPIVLSKVARMRGAGALSHAAFEEKVRRLSREELEPRRLQLVRRELPGGKMRFIIKSAATGAICETIEYEPPAGSDGAPKNLDRQNFAAVRLARAAT